MSLTVKTAILFNGQRYASPDALPPEIRAAYERALADGAGATTNRDVKAFVRINGQSFSSADEMAVAEKKLYDDAMQLIRDSREVKTTADITTASPGPATITAQSETETGLLTKRQIRLIIFVTGLIFAVTLLLILRH